MKQPSLWQERDTLPKLPHTAAIALLLLTAGLAGIFGGDGVAAFAVMMLLAAIYAVLLLLYRTPLVFLAIPVAYLVSFFFTRNSLTALPSLAFAPLGAVIALCIYRRRKCFRTVLWLTAVSLVLYAGIAAGTLYAEYGSVAEGIRAIRAEADKYLAEYWQTLVSTLGATRAADFEDSWKLLSSAYVYFLPGFAVMSAMILSWAACKLTRRFLIWLHADKFFFRKKWTVMVPLAWAYAYIIATVATLRVSLIGLVIEWGDWLVYGVTDLLMVLEPPLVAIGARRLRVTLRRLRRRGMTGMYILLVILMIGILCCAGFELLPFLIAYVGTMYVLRRAKLKRMRAAEAAAPGRPTGRPVPEDTDDDETDTDADAAAGTDEKPDGSDSEKDQDNDDGNDDGNDSESDHSEQ